VKLPYEVSKAVAIKITNTDDAPTVPLLKFATKRLNLER
jgi:hypothetical protein